MKIQGYRIDSYNQKIVPIDVNPDNGYQYLTDIAAHFSGIFCIGGKYIKNSIENILYVDDEGLLFANNDINHGFSFKSSDNRDSSVLIGNGFIEAINNEGQSISSNLTLEEVQGLIEFKTFSKEFIENRLNNSFKVYSL